MQHSRDLQVACEAHENTTTAHQRLVWQCTFSTTPERFKIRPFGAVRLTNWIAAGFARHPVCMSAAGHPHCVKQSCSKACVLHMLKKFYLKVLTLLTAILSGKPVRHRKMHIKHLICFHLNLPWKQARLEEQDTELPWKQATRGAATLSVRSLTCSSNCDRGVEPPW